MTTLGAPQQDNWKRAERRNSGGTVEHSLFGGDAKTDRHRKEIPPSLISTTRTAAPWRMIICSHCALQNPQRPSTCVVIAIRQQRAHGSTWSPLPPWPEPKGRLWISPAVAPHSCRTEFWPLAPAVHWAKPKPEPVTPPSAQQHHRIPKL